MNHCPVLLDSGACVPMPFLISIQVLETTCPGLTIDPIASNDVNQLSAVNGSPIELVGSVDLHLRFIGPNLEIDQSGIGLCLGQ